MCRFLACSVILSLLAAAAAGQATPPATSHTLKQGGLAHINARSWFSFYDEFQNMQRLLTLTADQQSRLKADVDAMNAAIDAAQQDLFGPPSEGLKLPTRARNASALQELQDTLDKIAAEGEIKILADLTPDQKIIWARTLLEPVISNLYGSLKLTPEQISQSGTLLNDAAKNLASAKSAGDYQTAQGQMIRRWINEILTAPQAAKVLRMNSAPITATHVFISDAVPPTAPAGGLP